MKLGILEEVKEHTDWVNSYLIVQKDTGNHHSPNHTVRKKLRICLDPRDLNEALEREPYHTHPTEEITTKFQSRDEMEHVRHFPTPMEMCMDDHLILIPKKIQALKQMEFPLDKETMSSFLGMINYLNRYSALSAHLAAPLSALTHQATNYKPEKTHFENFNQLKMEISNMKALPYFDVNAETTLQMDASKKELRACLIQKGKVVCYASRALTKTEQNYQNLEREELGAIWGMEKFHYFLYGKEFTLETDQKPLVSIYKKHMVDISPRLQRLIVRSFPYLPFKVVYKKGTDIPVADALS